MLSRYSERLFVYTFGQGSWEGLCISLLLDSSTQFWSNKEQEDSMTPSLPGVDKIKKTVEEFKKCLAITEEKAREIERDTREQCNSRLWFNA